AQLTAVYVLIFARKAEIDMMLCLLTTTAMFLVAHQPDDETRHRQFLRWIGIWGLLSLAWLGKFHYGPVMVIAPCGLYFLIQKRFRAIWNFLNPVGVLLFAAAVFIWPYLLLQQVPDAWQIWKTETVGRAVGALGHKPFWFYLPHLFWLTLPWTPFALAAVPGSWRRAWKEADARERFLWIWLLTQFVIVTVSANKHKHYLNTALPMVSLLAAQTLSRLVARIKQGNWNFSRRAAVIGSVCALAIGIAAVVLGVQRWPQLQTPFVVIGSMIAVGGIAANLLAFRGRPFWAGLTTAGTLLFCYAGVNGWIVPRRDHRLAVANFAKETRQILSAETSVTVYCMGETSVVYYLESPVQRLESQSALAERLNREGRLFVVTFEPLAKEVTACGEGRIIRRMPHRPGVPRPKHAPLVLLELKQKPQPPAIATTPRSTAR
ncbi:MAG: hypothetical protein IID45_09260, partial [Planctomycetes bacterium]|nr:hypothetical protein [Planctomycetota bacterium]